MATLTHAEKSFLKKIVTQVRGLLNLAWLLTLVSTLLFVWQAWILASIFSHWLNNYFNQLPLSTNISFSWLLGLLLCFALRPLLNTGRELLSAHASLKVRSQLRQSLLDTMASLGPNLRYFGSEGSLSSQIIDQTDALDGFISRFSVQKKVTVTTPIILLIAVAWQSKFAAFLLLLTAPLVPIFMILIGHLTARKSAAQFQALSQLSGRFLDWIRGMPTLKRLQATHIAEHDLALSSEDYRKRTMDVLKVAFLNGAVLELLAALSIALVAVYLGFGLMGILPWEKDVVPVPYFGALFILLLAPEFYVPLRQLGADYHAKAEAEGAVQSLLPIIAAANIANTTTDMAKTAQTLTQTKPTDTDADIALNQAFGLIFSNLSIRTPIAHIDDVNSKNTQNTDSKSQQEQHYRIRLAPVSFSLLPAQRMALVGDSGSGKSSLLQAIMGFVDYQGEILLQLPDQPQRQAQPAATIEPTEQASSSPTAMTAVSLQQLDINILRQHIGYLAQQVALMPLSIADNLRLANPDATEQQLIEALQQVELWELIQHLPDGINTQIGERGQGLSGGQQQRLGIAQLLLRKDSLWLLDEPTEHLDPDTAQRIHHLLERVSRGKTVIWVTHAHQQLNWLDDVVQLSLPQAFVKGEMQ
ncbi:thiol reductant ABC exporter subunit CydD [Psychrobacter lutiphocae]|uniref:thiol reductant ABC exporter subunit CydD n=1 Tax=Psychrobacter lutiphocae TaxID=540500 RepID=UPI00037C9A5E|nr:thiol reductant ABC exporter subunit CydD [Psychrobacter lutiphocae]